MIKKKTTIVSHHFFSLLNVKKNKKKKKDSTEISKALAAMYLSHCPSTSRKQGTEKI